MLSQCQMIGFIPTVDGTRARAFYCDLLGLELVGDDHFAIVVRAAHGNIRIVRTSTFTPQPFTVLGWEVSEIEAQVQELAARGVPFERFGFFEQDSLGIWTAPDGSKVAWFKDPDGNILSLSKHAAA